jgi:2-polyprenyl-3-methyl-5-hydroxy-6-metoxy-1,4-benzoquinol methylase
MHVNVSTTTEYTIADQQRMQAAKNYFQWQAKLSRAELGQRVLEVGCGMGNFSDHLADRQFVVGIDIDENCVARWQTRFQDRKHYAGFVMNAEASSFLDLRRYSIDSVVCLNVLEHIEQHELVLRQMCEILPSGGRVVLMVPAFEALYGEIDVRLGHFRRYTKASMTTVASAAGFRLQKLRYMNTVGFLGWWANAKIFKRSEQSEDQIAFFDSRIVPVMSRLEDLISPPFGQSIIAVLRKP